MRFVAGVLRMLLMGTVALGAGCACFPQHMVPTVTTMPNMGPPSQRPVASMDVKIYAGEPGNNPTPLTDGQPGMKDLVLLVHKTVDESGLFQQVHYVSAPSQPANAAAAATDNGDLHISLRIYDHCDATTALLANVITGFTLGLVPGGTTDNYTLQLEVTDNRGQTLARVSNEDATTTYIGLVFLPLTGHDTELSTHAVLANQIRAALKEAYDAGKLVAINTPPQRDRNGELLPVVVVK